MQILLHDRFKQNLGAGWIQVVIEVGRVAYNFIKNDQKAEVDRYNALVQRLRNDASFWGDQGLNVPVFNPSSIAKNNLVQNGRLLYLLDKRILAENQLASTKSDRGEKRRILRYVSAFYEIFLDVQKALSAKGKNANDALLAYESVRLDNGRLPASYPPEGNINTSGVPEQTKETIAGDVVQSELPPPNNNPGSQTETGSGLDIKNLALIGLGIFAATKLF